MERLKFEEEAWNTRDPERISEGYADNIEMRDGTDFVNGRSELKSFLGRLHFGKTLTGLIANRTLFANNVSGSPGGRVPSGV